MESSQWKKSEELQSMQLELIKRLVDYAGHHVPYYVNLFSKAGASQATIRDFDDDFTKIPISTKSMIRPVYPEHIYARQSWLDIKTRTSGTTGEPFECVVDGKNHCWHLASSFLFDSWMGIGSEEPWFRIAASQEASHYNSPLASAAVRAGTRLLRPEVHVSMELIARPRFTELISLIDRSKPSGLSSSASALALIAKQIQEMRATLVHKLKGVFSTGESLLPSHRQLISAFVCPNVFNRFGLREFGGYLAQDCESHEGLHINPFLVYAEVVRDDGSLAPPGEIGRLLLTDLRNYAMPFIRYDTGNTATVVLECECGRGFPVLGKLIGREGDYVLTKLGLLPSIKVIDDFAARFASNIRAFQFIQFPSGKVLVKIAPMLADKGRGNERVARFLASYFTEFDIELVPEITPEPSGKRPAFRSVKSNSTKKPS